MKLVLRSLAAAALATAAASSALAAGPVSGEVTALYWASNTTIADSESEHSYDAAARAELWFVKKFGLAAAWYRPQPENAPAVGVESMQYANLDLKWRFLSPTKNNFLALGAGWQQVDVSGGYAFAGDESTSGPRILVEGRACFVKVLYGYARGAWLPTLADWTSSAAGDLRDGDGYEAEAGLQIKPTAFIQIFLAYRMSHTSFVGAAGSVDFDHDGPVVGFGVNF